MSSSGVMGLCARQLRPQSLVDSKVQIPNKMWRLLIASVVRKEHPFFSIVSLQPARSMLLSRSSHNNPSPFIQFLLLHRNRTWFAHLKFILCLVMLTNSTYLSNVLQRPYRMRVQDLKMKMKIQGMSAYSTQECQKSPTPLHYCGAHRWHTCVLDTFSPRRR